MEKVHEVRRVEGFSDAVFGFALTLLVVMLDVPKNTAELVTLLRGSVPFAVTFAMICWIWYEHQQFFRSYGMQDPWTISVNCFLLFVVLFYVYPLKYLAVTLIGPLSGYTTLGAIPENAGPLLMLVYSTGVFLIFGSFVVLHRHAWHLRDKLGLTADEQVKLKFAARGHALSTALGAVSIAIVSIGLWLNGRHAPFYGGILYSLMGPLHGMNGYQAGKARAELQKQQTTNDAKR